MNEELKQEIFVFLDNLRESGEVNMFGSGAYVMEMFDVSKTEAREYVTAWMQSFSDRHPKS